MPTPIKTPSETVKNGWDNWGRFGKGNQAARGNSVPRKAAQFSAKLFSAVSLADFSAIVRATIADAKKGDRYAHKLLFDSLIGPSIQIDLLEKMEQLERDIQSLKDDEN